ncbi:uncharacterized protein [Euphorbia lathyris]|uniref:uncharacterized protein isoform X1 n=1 Tax=Euphorbia lathyris TaxID=212925 RepID=UPI0033131CCF
MNSVDFLFEVDADGRQFLYLFERGKKKLMEGNTVVYKDDSDPASYSGKIIECSWDSEEQVWECMRIRTDKNTPNDFNTYRKVMRSIKDNITEEVLLNEIGEITLFISNINCRLQFNFPLPLLSCHYFLVLYEGIQKRNQYISVKLIYYLISLLA